MDARDVEMLSLVQACRLQAEVLQTLLKIQADALRQVSEIKRQRLQSKALAASAEHQRAIWNERVKP